METLGRMPISSALTACVKDSSYQVSVVLPEGLMTPKMMSASESPPDWPG